MPAKQSHAYLHAMHFALLSKAACLPTQAGIVLRGNINQDGTDKASANLPPTLTDSAINKRQQYVGFSVFKKPSTAQILQQIKDSSCLPF